MMTRKSETPEEQAAREAEELRYREEPSPAKNYRDANILASVWSSMPPTVSGIGVKEIIKTITFGNRTQLNRLRRQYGPRSFSNAIESSLTIFFRMVEDYERSISLPPAMMIGSLHDLIFLEICLASSLRVLRLSKLMFA